MPNVYFIRAEFGKYVNDFLHGGFATLGTLNNLDLSGVTTRFAQNPTLRKIHCSGWAFR